MQPKKSAITSNITHHKMKILGNILKAAIATLLLTIYPTLKITAEERSAQEMLTIAKSVFGKRLQKERTQHSAKGTETAPQLVVAATTADITGGLQDSEAFKVYTFGNGAPGYVIVSADDCLPEVIGYSDTDCFSLDNIPDAMRHMLTAYSNALQKSNGESLDNNLDPGDETTFVNPLLGEIAFNQNAPFNNKCPMQNGQRSVVGCLATAMSELMAYHRYPSQMYGNDISYSTKTHNIPVKWKCSQTVFDWDNILDRYAGYVPDFTGTLKIGNMQYMILTGISVSKQYYGYLELYNFLNITNVTLNFTTQIILADKDGNMIRPVGTPLEISNLPVHNLYKTQYLTHAMPNDIEDGTYRFYVGVKKAGTSEWTIVKRATNANDLYNSSRVNCYLTVTKKGNTYSIGNNTFYCSYTDEQGDAVATLSAACGAAALMDYAADGSGALQTDGMHALYTNMNYDDRMIMVDQSFFTEEGWHKHIQSELQAKRPILCCGAAESGVAHAYVIDGYKYMNKKPYYHISWGWGGSSNGYFLITDMTPTAAGTGGEVTNYGYKSWLTTGLTPYDGNDDGHTLGATEIALNKTSATSLTAIAITLKNIVHCSVPDFSGKLSAYAIDSIGNEYLIGSFFSYSNWKTYHGFSELKRNVKIPATIPTGDYQIEIRAKANKSDCEKAVLAPTLPTLHIDNHTAIESVSAEQTHSQATYDLMGRPTNNPKNRQIYIKSGKKYINR